MIGKNSYKFIFGNRKKKYYVFFEYNRAFTDGRVPRVRPHVLLVKAGQKQGRSLGSKEGKVLGSGRFE
jgi:hypothetical protein